VTDSTVDPAADGWDFGRTGNIARRRQDEGSWVMKIFVAISAVALIGATAAYAAPQPDQAQASQFACDLGGDCGSASTAPASAEPESAAPAGAPRASSVRGFTFTRHAPTAAPDATTSAPSPAPATGMAAATKPMTMPAHNGSANLRLDFASGSSDLNDGDRTRLAALASALSTPRLVGRRVRIEGHTDSKGSAQKNLDLSRRRAQSAADYLVSTGVDRARLDVVGYGSKQPLPGHSADDGANRRVMAVMLN
jgi:OmpA-OmpF porin, OOP family